MALSEGPGSSLTSLGTVAVPTTAFARVHLFVKGGNFLSREPEFGAMRNRVMGAQTRVGITQGCYHARGSLPGTEAKRLWCAARRRSVRLGCVPLAMSYDTRRG